MKKMLRICPNSAIWSHPTKKESESKDSFTGLFGFGFEEWLNREDWVLSGYSDLIGMWRYVYLHGLWTKSGKYDGTVIDILLFVKERGCPPYAVARIENVHVINEEEAAWATKKFYENRWIHSMHAEVLAVGGNTEGLPPLSNDSEFAWNPRISLANVRFRSDSLYFFDRPKRISLRAYYYAKPYAWNGDIPDCDIVAQSIAPPNCDNQKLLNRFSENIRKAREQSGKEYPPRQAPIQNALSVQIAEYLKSEGGVVTCEDDRVDIKIVSGNNVVSFIEIKPSRSAREAIRCSIGQLLEYSNYPTGRKADRFFIVSDVDIDSNGLEYLRNLKILYGIDIKYIYWNRDTKTLDADTMKIFK